MIAKINKNSFLKLIFVFFLSLIICSIKAQKIRDIISVKDFQHEDYKLFFHKDYNFNSKKISLHIFEKNGKRELVLCEKISTRKDKIILINNDIIYPEISECIKGGFKKIVKKGVFITIEENFCTTRREQYLKEYFTFKYSESESNFFLNKYSFNLVSSLPADDNLPPRSYIEDELPTETYTEKDFGKIQIIDFNFDKIENIRNRYLEDK